MAPINVTTSSEKVTATVSEDKVTATVSGASPVSATVTAGFGATGPQGPSGVVNVTAPITNAGTTTAANIGLAIGEGLSVSSGSLRVTPGTYATLVDGTVPSNLLPSYVDDVLEFANVASLPNTGETGKIYVAINTGKIYRWSGSAYFEISTPPDNTDAVPEGSSNLYFTNARARNSFGTGAAGQVVAWSGSEWTAGTVVIASVTGLQTALDGKAASSHNHDASAINAGTLAADRLPLAAANTRGAVRIGSGISIDGNGVISASSGYTLPTATGSVLGGVKIGTGVSITDGVISVSTAYAATSHAHAWSDITSGVPAALSGGYFAIDDDDFLCLRSLDMSSPVKVETVAGAYGGFKLYSLDFFDPETDSFTTQTTAWTGTVAAANVTGLAAVATSGSYNDLTNKPTIPSAYTLPTASSTVLGGVKIGSGISIDGSGVISASAGYTLPNATTSTLGGVIVGTGLSVSSGTVSANVTSVAGRTGAVTIAAADVSGLGGAATLNVGTTSGTVAAGDHTHAQLHDRSHAITSSSDHTATAWRLFYSEGGGVITELALGSSGTVLTSGGASAAPTFSALPAGGTKTVIRFTPGDNQPPASNFATLDTRNSFLVLEYDASTQESANFIGVIPEGATLTNGLTVRLWWMGDTATSGNVRWGVSFEAVGTDNDADSFSSVTEATGAANGTSGIETVTEITATAIDSLVAGNRFRLRVARIAADATNDTMTGDAQLVAVEVRVA
jgi:hypothetical protein